MHLKKIFLILFGISIVLLGVIFVIYKNNESKTEEVIDIFKEEKEEIDIETEEKEEYLNNQKVVVDIKGMVESPGVYEVDFGSRVNDVINLAGGLIEGANTSLINLAKIVTDEMTIIIYSNDEVLERYKEEVCVCDCPLVSNDACINNSENMDKELVNINTATKEDLMTVSGVGDTKAESIIKYREENGDFKTIEDIKNVSGIGESLFEKIKDYITV